MKKQYGFVGLTPNSKRTTKADGVKTCNSCLQTYSLDKFYSNGYTPKGTQKYKAVCIKCENSLRKSEIVEQILEYLSIQGKEYLCENCGYTGEYGSLDFHHIDPNTKLFSIGNFTSKTVSDDRFISELAPEIDKCRLLCPNCHRQEHLLMGRK
jgi:5-methylcytosine-specific restriction endonuclease McrA